jgi:hypothetical protein
MQLRIEPFLLFLNTISVLAAPLGGAAAAKRQGAVNALDIDGSSCGFDSARSRPAKIIKGAKKAAEHAVFPAELGVAPRVTSLPAGRFVIP